MSYLRDHIKMVGEHFDNKLYQFIFKNGMDCQFDPARSFDISPGVKQECYRNATLTALETSHLTFVEGYVTIYGVPISHAWLVDRTGLVFEPTLRPDDSVDRIAEYFGVPFKTEYVLKALKKNKVYGLLDPWHSKKTFMRMIEGKENFRADIKVETGAAV